MTASPVEGPGPYASAALDYLDAGWTAPLPVRGKHPPPEGWTGHGAPVPSYADVTSWTEDFGARNIGLRLPPILLAIDVDAYGQKRGAETLAECEAKWGPLPPTWRSTSRDDGVSGIRVFRIPEGLSWPGQLPGGGVELCHSGHRYVMAWPSIHPEGRIYRWLEPSGLNSLRIPKVAELPLLPPEWVAGLTRGPYRAEQSVTVDNEWIDTLPGGPPCSEMASRADKMLAAMVRGSRHEAALEGTLTLVRLAEQGHPGLLDELSRVGAAFIGDITVGDGSRSLAAARGEWERIVSGAAARVAGQPSLLRLPFDPCRPPFPGQPRGATPPAARITTAAAPTLAVAQRWAPGLDDVTGTPASAIRMRRARWLWDGRIPAGALTLLAGPQGLGKSTLAYWLAAQVSRGELPGESSGTPRAVLVTATEDAWAEVIVPRLVAADGDLDRIFRMDAGPVDAKRDLQLPADLAGVARLALHSDAALILMDPLMSRLGKLDSHKDAEVRVALEPLTRMLDQTRMAAVGIAHLNKGSGTNAVDRVMGSVAFTAVARSVLAVITDPEDEQGRRRLVGLVKSNLGRTDLPTLAFTVENETIWTPDGATDVGKVVWGADSEASVQEAMETAADGSEMSNAVKEAADWLTDYLEKEGGAPATVIKSEARKVGISEAALHRARKRLKIIFTNRGHPRQSWWHFQGFKVGEDE